MHEILNISNSAEEAIPAIQLLPEGKEVMIENAHEMGCTCDPDVGLTWAQLGEEPVVLVAVVHDDDCTMMQEPEPQINPKMNFAGGGSPSR